MKKNLRKIAALLAVTMAMTAMTTSAFAAYNPNDVVYGDVDLDGMVTSNDAAMLLAYALQPSADKIKEQFAKEEVQTRALVTKELVNTQLKDGTIDTTNAAVGAAAILQKILGNNDVFTNPAAQAKKEYVQIGINSYVMSDRIDHATKLADAMGTLLTSDATSSALRTNAAAALSKELANYTVEGKDLSTADGWTNLGKIILPDNAGSEVTTAFNALRPTANASDDYFKNFAANLAKAFPSGTDTTAIEAKISAANINGTYEGISFKINGEEQLGKDAKINDFISNVVTKILYNNQSSVEKLGNVEEFKNITITSPSGSTFSISAIEA